MSEQGEEHKAALVVVAHPDDAEFGCGGTIAAWAREGWEITLVVCTDGGSGGPDDAEDVGPDARRRVSETRKAEQLRAAKELGLKEVVFLDLRDGELMPTLELRREIVRQIRRLRASRVVCQSPDRAWTPHYTLGRYHPDHLAAGAATVAAVYPAAQNGWDFPELLAEGLRPHKVKELYITAAPTQNFAIDVSETFEQKLAALRQHVSQLGADQTELANRLRQWAVERGEPFNVAMAETFHKVEN